MYILLVGLNHKTAPLSVREQFSFTERQRHALYASFRGISTLESLVILSTCNRTEMYAVTRNLDMGKKDICRLLLQHVQKPEQSLRPFFYTKECDDAVLHLYRVASGLDSMILGETQILGQIKQAYAEAKQCGASGRIMNQLMQKTFSVGKKVRSSTAIDQHSLSVSYVAVDQAKKNCGGLLDKKVLVVGVGEAGQLTARYLKEEGVQAIFISNRSITAAQQLAKDLDGIAVQFDVLAHYLQEVDIVISCTGANHLVIHGEVCRQALQNRQKRPIFMVDIAVPRDIDPALAQIEGVQLWDMDRLQSVVLDNEKERILAARLGESIIQEEMQMFRKWSAALHVTPVVAALKARGKEIRQRELERAFNRLGKESLTEREKKIITEMGQAIVNQLLRSPVENIKELAVVGQGEVYAAVMKKLFGLEWAEEDGNHEASPAASFSDWNPRQ